MSPVCRASELVMAVQQRCSWVGAAAPVGVCGRHSDFHLDELAEGNDLEPEDDETLVEMTHVEDFVVTL